MDKLKAFFQKKGVMITEAILLVAGAVGLTISGVSAEGIGSVVNLSIAGVGAIDAILTFIAALIGKKKE